MAEAKYLLIVYRSQSGTTSKMADAVIGGAKHPDIEDVEVRVLTVPVYSFLSFARRKT